MMILQFASGLFHKNVREEGLQGLECIFFQESPPIQFQKETELYYMSKVVTKPSTMY